MGGVFAGLSRDPHKVVVMSMLGTGAVIVIANARKGSLPPPRSVIALGVVYLVLAGLADVAGPVAAPFALLVFAGVVLKEGLPAFGALSGLVGGSGPVGVPNNTQTASIASPATTTGGAQSANNDVPPSAIAQRAVSLARSQVGVPYKYGGETKGVGFDCSGLCQWSYKLAGFTIPRTSEEQAEAGFMSVQLGSFAPGDLVFSDWPGDNDPSPGHVVMYAGAGVCVAAPHPGTTVQMEELSTFLNPANYRGTVRPAPGR